MSDRIWHAEPPLTQDERDTRFDHSSRIQIESQSSRPTIRRDWVRGNAGDDANYGYAETRSYERTSETTLDLKVAGLVDAVALTQVILEEVKRQRAVLVQHEISKSLETQKPLDSVNS